MGNGLRCGEQAVDKASTCAARACGCESDEPRTVAELPVDVDSDGYEAQVPASPGFRPPPMEVRGPAAEEEQEVTML